MTLGGIKLASRMCLCCCATGRIWTSAGATTDRSRTAYGTSRIRAPSHELEGAYEAPTANGIQRGIPRVQETDHRRAAPQTLGEAEGGPAAPVARGPRARQKVVRRHHRAQLPPARRRPLERAVVLAAAAPQDLLEGEGLRRTAARVRVYNARRANGLLGGRHGTGGGVPRRAGPGRAWTTDDVNERLH